MEDSTIEEKEEERNKTKMRVLQPSSSLPPRLHLSPYRAPTSTPFDKKMLRYISRDKKREYISAVLIFLACRKYSVAAVDDLRLSLVTLAHSLGLQIAQLKQALGIVQRNIHYAIL